MVSDERRALVERLLRTLLQPVGPCDEATVGQLRERAFRAFKDFKSPRVNQFAVRDRLEGLAERAEVLNRPELADVLRQRVAAAEHLHNKLMPEHLTLLLELSDRPVEQTDLESLDAIGPPEADVLPSWAEILRDDPLDNSSGLWNTVDFAEQSSIDSDALSFSSWSSDSILRSAVPEIEGLPATSYSQYEVQVDFQDLDDFKSLSRASPKLTEEPHQGSRWLSELQVVRECIFLLRGCNSDIFARSGNVVVSKPNIEISNLSRDALDQFLKQFASLGSRLHQIRAYTQEKFVNPVMQSAQWAIARELRNFDSVLNGIEERCTVLGAEPVTMIDLLSQVRLSVRTLLPLGKLCDLERNLEMDSVVALETLYNHTCLQQSLGNIKGYIAAINVLTVCLDTYFLSIKHWVLTGDIPEYEPSFFIEKRSGPPNSDFWSSEFRVVQIADGCPRVPCFLQSFVQRIFTTGKSRKLLSILSREAVDVHVADFKLMPEPSGSGCTELIPFSKVLEESLDQWIAPILMKATSSLSATLDTQYRLQRTTQAIQGLFLGQQGPSFDQVADSFLDRLESSSTSLEDPLTLTGIYQEAYSLSMLVEEDCISVRTLRKDVQGSPMSRVRHTLENVEISYRISWAISNILQPSTMRTYRDVHRMLLHLRIAKRAIDEKFHQKTILHGMASQRSSTLALRLSHRLRWFSHTLQSYFFGIALQGAVPRLLSKLEANEDIDAKIAAHDRFIETIRRRFLLNSKAAQTQQALLSVCDLTFATANYLRSQWRVLHRHGDENPDPVMPSLSAENEELRSEKLEGFASNYSKYLSFVHHGVQEAARYEGDKCLQMLADSLSFGLDVSKNLGAGRNGHT